MANARVWQWRVVLVVLTAITVVPMLYASGLLDRDQRRLERAREAHAEEIERAVEIYTRRVERANETLERVYDQLITRYEQRGDRELAESLQRELDEIVEQTHDIGVADESQPGGHDALIEAVGPVLVDAYGRAINSAALQEANHVVLFFSASWCGPCRRFTPQLKEFYQRFSQQHRIAVIYVSSDRSADQMTQYLEGSDMPWHAVPYSRVDESGLKRQFNARGGIPNVVILDRDGEVVLRSTYPDMPPARVLEVFAQSL